MTTSSAIFRRLSLIVTAAALISITVGSSGCSKKNKGDEGSVPNASAADENAMGDSDSGKAMGLESIHFSYDNSTLSGEAKKVLKSNAEILKSHSSAKIQVEGHCDRHGGIQYNIALGEKRANATKKYLQDLGVSGDRVTTVSFGKEKPVDAAETEEADAKNRRANFVITSR